LALNAPEVLGVTDVTHVIKCEVLCIQGRVDWSAAEVPELCKPRLDNGPCSSLVREKAELTSLATGCAGN
jgi:hypothetical protein